MNNIAGSETLCKTVVGKHSSFANYWFLFVFVAPKLFQAVHSEPERVKPVVMLEDWVIAIVSWPVHPVVVEVLLFQTKIMDHP